jgi:hypothetical protein
MVNFTIYYAASTFTLHSLTFPACGMLTAIINGAPKLAAPLHLSLPFTKHLL